MAYINQADKALIAIELKKIVPKGWKYSLSIRHHSTIQIKIASAPVNLLEGTGRESQDYANINTYHLANAVAPQFLETFQAIKDALNLNNFDHSDIQSDYFHVGHYIDITIGTYDKPFVVK